MFVIFEQVIVLNKKRSSILFLLEDKALQRNTNKVRTDELISKTVKASEISSPHCFLTSFQHSAPKNYLASHQWFFLNPKALILNFHWSSSVWILTHKSSCWLFTLVHQTYRFSCWSCSRAWKWNGVWLGFEKNHRCEARWFLGAECWKLVRKQRGEEISPALTVSLISSSVLTCLCFFVMPYLPIGIRRNSVVLPRTITCSKMTNVQGDW